MGRQGGFQRFGATSEYVIFPPAIQTTRFFKQICQFNSSCRDCPVVLNIDGACAAIRSESDKLLVGQQSNTIT